jgi:hypothetical protein
MNKTKGGKVTKIALKRNESFNIREGWLSKGTQAVKANPAFFSREDAMDELGVGSKMVKSIRFWLQATGLTKEKRAKGGHFEQTLTEDFGEVIYQYDRYFEDVSTLWLLHANIASNKEMCCIWYLFFNYYTATTFTKNDFEAFAQGELDKIAGEECSYSEKLMEDDCASVLRMYLSETDNADPEDNTASPLRELGLVKREKETKGVLVKTRPAMGTLDKMIVLYVIIKRMQQGTTTVSIDDLLYAEMNIGKVFNLNRELINEYLDQLRAAGYISINRTAGLDMVYIEKKLSPAEVLELYYTE